jgi:hypothetical protein
MRAPTKNICAEWRKLDWRAEMARYLQFPDAAVIMEEIDWQGRFS